VTEVPGTNSKTKASGLAKKGAQQRARRLRGRILSPTGADTYPKVAHRSRLQAPAGNACRQRGRRRRV